jgi:hypothetical protein
MLLKKTNLLCGLENSHKIRKDAKFIKQETIKRKRYVVIKKQVISADSYLRG